ncbi:saccharopine dehydrogenase C-terminal domain-containing protein [Paracoccus aerodenitrificans]|uniref:saccharopine dehydrogenase C-terminal domain-containing protein n=1 Tax=Paracoccus aerodenitrificans TaxID=3017781 RepID=UPI0022F025E7|nr:saccharopine dehydrogenase C-terminal domain-containing protein [Paracoccus aerodenitrificans]WBU63882.1 hypothetical protein PAE61_16365 [Paracoccus aerodenitrificans]
MTTTHWVHAGVDALFGINKLIGDGTDLRVWTRDDPPLAGVSPELQRRYEPEALWKAVEPGDIIIAPRPTDLAVARLAMDRGAHLAVGWHVSPELTEAVSSAAEKELSVLSEVGMVPGIDHLMARDLVNDYSQNAEPEDVLHFTSYGGGMPKHPDNFRHKFNISPLSLLNSLATPTSWIEDGQTKRAEFPFDVIRAYDLNLPTPERHQVYPYYDIDPYLKSYGFDPAWTLSTAERGAIRLKGWNEGWASVFDSIRQTGKETNALARLAEELWEEHPFAPGEADRVVLSVSLRAEQNGKTRWHKEWVLDDRGGIHGFARFRLQSMMYALAAKALSANEIKPGLHIGPTAPHLIASWLVEITNEARYSRRINHLREEEPQMGLAS